MSGIINENLRRSYELYMLLLLAYAVMIAGAFIAFQRRHKAIGIVFLLVMVLSILILGYLWIHSPM